MKFSLFQNLNYLKIKFTGKFKLTDESFKSDLPTDTLLNLHLDLDGLQVNSLESNALSYAYRPIHVHIEQSQGALNRQCQTVLLEEEIYAPFLAVNPDNKIRVQNCPVQCDCSIKWLFDAPKDWWMRVEAGDTTVGLQCDDLRSLYFYSDYDFRTCPKSNLLKYFVPENTSKLTNSGALPAKATEPELSQSPSLPVSSSAEVHSSSDKSDDSSNSSPAVSSTYSSGASVIPVSDQIPQDKVSTLDVKVDIPSQNSHKTLDASNSISDDSEGVIIPAAAIDQVVVKQEAASAISPSGDEPSSKVLPSQQTDLKNELPSSPLVSSGPASSSIEETNLKQSLISDTSVPSLTSEPKDKPSQTLKTVFRF